MIPSSSRRVLSIVIRIGLTVVCIGLIPLFVPLGEVWHKLKEARWDRCALAIAIVVFAYVEMAFRWWLLMGAAGVATSFRAILWISWSGNFFNQFLPGGVGGDVARAVLAAKDVEKKAAVVGSVLLDRILGLVGLLMMGLTASLLHGGREGMRQATLGSGGLLCAIGVSAILYFHPWVRRSSLGRWIRDRLGNIQALADFDMAMKAILTKPWTLLACILLAVLGQSLVCLAIYGLAGGLHIDGFRAYHAFAYLPMVFVAMALPISIGAWGVGEMAFEKCLSWAGFAKGTGVALSLLYRICGVLASIPGGLIFASGWAKVRPSRACEGQVA